MITLRRKKRPGWFKRRDDGISPSLRSINRSDDPRGDRLLFGGVKKDRRAVLRADIVALAIRGRWIVHPKKPSEEILKRELRSIIRHLDSFGVP